MRRHWARLAQIVAVSLFVSGFSSCNLTPQQTQVIQTAVGLYDPSVSATPPSSVFLPGLSTGKWLALSVPGSKSNGLGAQLIELRGWLNEADTQCNGADPDWHWGLLLDPEWADSLGLDLNQVITAGNINFWSDHRLMNTAQIVVGRAVVHVELNGLPRAGVVPWNFTPPGPPAKQPSLDWGFSTADPQGCPNVTWAFNPTNPIPWQPPLLGGQYVRIAGSLVTDEPHDEADKVPVFLLNNLGINVGNPNPPTNCTGWQQCTQTEALQKNWQQKQGKMEPSNPARWVEIHPPDIISVLDSTGRNVTTGLPAETVEGATVFDGNCLTDVLGLGCSGTSLDVDIPVQSPRPPGATAVQAIECVGTETNQDTIVEGDNGFSNNHFAQVWIPTAGNGYPTASSIHVHVRVQGQAGYGAPGKFKAIYRIFWNTQAPPHPPTSWSPPAPNCRLIGNGPTGGMINVKIIAPGPIFVPPGSSKASVALQVTDSNGNPLQNAHLFIYSSLGSNSNTSAFTDADGNATMVYLSCQTIVRTTNELGKPLEGTSPSGCSGAAFPPSSNYAYTSFTLPLPSSSTSGTTSTTGTTGTSTSTPDFQLTAVDISTPSHQYQATIMVTSVNNFQGIVTLQIPTGGVTRGNASLSKNSVTISPGEAGRITLSANAGSWTQPITVTVKASGSGGLQQTVMFTLYYFKTLTQPPK